jgi:hypothetical protein
MFTGPELRCSTKLLVSPTHARPEKPEITLPRKRGEDQTPPARPASAWPKLAAWRICPAHGGIFGASRPAPLLPDGPMPQGTTKL